MKLAAELGIELVPGEVDEFAKGLNRLTTIVKVCQKNDTKPFWHPDHIM